MYWLLDCVYFCYTKSSSHIQVAEPCLTRTPEYFIITVMNSGRTVNTTTVESDHQLGSQLAVTIEVPQNMNMCSLYVNISAGNSAGMSLPTEIEVGRSHHVFNHDWIKFLINAVIYIQNVPLNITTQTALLLPALELIQTHLILLSLTQLNKKIVQ